MSIYQYVWRLIRYKPWLFLANALAWTANHVFPLVLGLLMRAFFDSLSGKAAIGSNVWTVVAYIAGAEAFHQLIAVVGIWVWGTYWEMMQCLIRSNMLDWLVQGPGTRRLPGAPGETVSRFRDDVIEVMRCIERWVDMWGLVVFTIVAILIMLRISSSITLVTFPPLLVIIGIVQWLSGRITRYRKANREAAARVAAFVGETFNSVQAVKVASAERQVIEHFRQLNEHRRRAAQKDNLLAQVMGSVFNNVVNLGTGIILILAAGAIQRGSFTVGDFALFTAYLPRVTAVMFFVGDMLAQHKKARVSLERIEELLDCAPPGTLALHRKLYLHSDPPDVPAAPKTPEDRLQVLDVQGLTYRFPDSDRGIENICMSVRRGSFVVVTGRIGSGKTTLLRCLLGLVKPEQGQIRWNENIVEDPASVLIPPKVAYTPQIPRLFSETLRSNIVAGCPADECVLDDSVRLAVMERDIAELEEGLETMVGPRGVKLSGGQIQRGAAARMFIRDAELLVFDDLSSALDVETEQMLWDQVFTQHHSTCLVVSHRRAALAHADHIIVLKDGRVHAEGQLKELLESCEEMQRLWHGEWKADSASVEGSPGNDGED